MPQNRLKYFPTAVIRRGMAHFHPALPMPGYLPPRYDEARAYLTGEAGGPRPTGDTVPRTTTPSEIAPLPDRP
jgi:hypothetical protein